jgi:hypothetical protein
VILDVSKLTQNLPLLTLIIPGNLTLKMKNLTAIYVVMIWWQLRFPN